MQKLIPVSGGFLANFGLTFILGHNLLQKPIHWRSFNYLLQYNCSSEVAKFNLDRSFCIIIAQREHSVNSKLRLVI
jgi:hypothetical protein